jgi:zinc/manganese transport system substrate-binding protein
MNDTKARRMLFIVVAIAAVSIVAVAATSPESARLSVAVAEPNVQAIVRAVGGSHVDTFSLFKGCILRENLMVERAAEGRLAKVSAIVWTGFLNESAAITASLEKQPATTKGLGRAPKWIDVSKGAARTNIPSSPCFGNSDPKTMSGDPFFWLNPENGSIIARNVAEGLGALQPQNRPYFLANAAAFKAALDKDIIRWKAELKPLRSLRIFSAQCGWQNFSKLGGPTFVVCKRDLGSLPTPEHLVDRVKEMKAQIVIVDPNTPPEYGNVLREKSGARVIEVASSIENLPGADSYSALFENFVQALQRAAKN